MPINLEDDDIEVIEVAGFDISTAQAIAAMEDAEDSAQAAADSAALAQEYAESVDPVGLVQGIEVSVAGYPMVFADTGGKKAAQADLNELKELLEIENVANIAPADLPISDATQLEFDEVYLDLDDIDTAIDDLNLGIVELNADVAALDSGKEPAIDLSTSDYLWQGNKEWTTKAGLPISDATQLEFDEVDLDVDDIDSAIVELNNEVVLKSYTNQVVGTITDIVDRISYDAAVIASRTREGRVNIEGEALFDGSMETVANLEVNGGPNSMVRITAQTRVGAVITNVVVTADEEDRIQDNLRFNGINFTGEDYPDPDILVVSSATTTSITFTSDASAVDDYYNGRQFQVLEGTGANATGIGTITDYVGSTRTATFSALSITPDVAAHVQIGFNENAYGFADGASGVKIIGGDTGDLPMSKMTPPVGGGKGVGLEQGVKDVVVTGKTFKNYFTAVFLGGRDGVNDNGSSKEVTGVRISDIHAEQCGSFISAGNIDGAAGISGNPDENQAVISNSTYKNCGHAPLRIVGTDQQKCGVINLFGAQNLLISNISGYNDSDVVTQLGGYPTDYPARCGYGLSGPIGAMVWGHARNVTVRNYHHHGDVDALVHVGRCRAIGDDANGAVTDMSGWNMELHHYGAADKLVKRDEVIGVTGSEIKGYWTFVVDDITTSFIPTAWTTATNLIIDVTKRSDGTRVIGKASDILKHGNTFADYIAGELTDLRATDRYRLTIADDDIFEITPLRNNGRIRFNTAATSSAASNNHAEIIYCIQGAAQATLISGTNITVGTTALTVGAGDGVDGNWNVAAVVSDCIQFKNRKGGSRVIDVTVE